MYYLVSHVVFQKDIPIFGPIHVVAEYLKLRKKQFIQITAPLTFEGSYEVLSEAGCISQPVVSTNPLLKYLADLFFIVRQLFDTAPTKNDVVIAADPLCAFPFIFLRLFLNFKLIYYTVDYSDQRFDNRIIEKIYKFLDLLALTSADSNWCVSTRIVQVRVKQGFGKKAIFVPNTNISTRQPTTQKSSLQNELLYVGRMEKNMFIFEILNLFKSFKKVNPQLHLTLIGGGSAADQVKERIKKYKLDSSIQYLGPLPNDVVQKYVRSSGIGLALYGDSKNWNRYGDSMKIREYQQFGLPVITTDVPSNAEEVAASQAGIVIPFESVTATSIIAAITEIQKNYHRYTTQAKVVAQKNLKTEILDRLLQL